MTIVKKKKSILFVWNLILKKITLSFKCYYEGVMKKGLKNKYSDDWSFGEITKTNS